MLGDKIDDKPNVEHTDDIDLEKAKANSGDAGGEILAGQRVELTEEDNRRIRRKTDKVILAILVWVYFLQIFDKVVFGLGNVYGLSTDIGLTGKQYSMAGSIHAIAQLAWQPFSAYILVKFPARHLMTIFVFCWGVAAACMAASTNYKHIYVTRFFLGLFEAGCLPLFGLITSQWWRRSEQPLRIAAWYGTNGIATIVGGIMAFAFGQITNGAIHEWQILYLFAGLITIITAPLVWWKLDSNIHTARFFADEHEKAQAVERLRANQTGTGTNEWKWAQVLEVIVDPKAYLWLTLAALVNIGAAVTNVFGPTLIRNFGFSKDVTTLLTMPFGFLQTVAILIGCYCATKFKVKSAVLAGLMSVVVAGCAMLFNEGTRGTADPTRFRQGVALAGYYLMSMLFGGNPLIVSWMIANTAGGTKKSCIMALFNMASAAGNIAGPFLFATGKPYYVHGTRACLIIFCALILAIGIQVVLLFMFNKQRQNQRVAHGKPKYIHDTSMEDKYQAYGEDEHGQGGVGQNALLDLTDIKNDEFVYVY